MCLQMLCVEKRFMIQLINVSILWHKTNDVRKNIPTLPYFAKCRVVPLPNSSSLTCSKDHSTWLRGTAPLLSVSVWSSLYLSYGPVGYVTAQEVTSAAVLAGNCSKRAAARASHMLASVDLILPPASIADEMASLLI